MSKSILLVVLVVLFLGCVPIKNTQDKEEPALLQEEIILENIEEEQGK